MSEGAIRPNTKNEAEASPAPMVVVEAHNIGQSCFKNSTRLAIDSDL